MEKMSDCPVCRHKAVPRSDESRKLLDNRINRMIGQLNGIKKMIDDNRYCGDILIQVSAVEKALQNFGYVILKEHMESCVTEQIKAGNEDVIEETVELIKKMK